LRAPLQIALDVLGRVERARRQAGINGVHSAPQEQRPYESDESVDRRLVDQVSFLLLAGEDGGDVANDGEGRLHDFQQCIDHDGCRDYFVGDFGCAIFLAVCPFSQVGYDTVKARFKGNGSAPQFRVPQASEAR